MLTVVMWPKEWQIVLKVMKATDKLARENGNEICESADWKRIMKALEEVC